MDAVRKVEVVEFVLGEKLSAQVAAWETVVT